MFLKIDENLEIIEASDNLLNKFDLLKEQLLGINFLDIVLNSVPSTVIEDLKEHCRNGLSGSYILHIRLNKKVCWLNVRFQAQDNFSLESTFEVRFFQLDKLSVRNAKDMYALMTFEGLSKFEQNDCQKVFASNSSDFYHEFY